MKQLFPTLLFCFFANFSFSQITITYQNPDSLYVCGQDSFFVFLKNTAATPSAALAVEIELNNGLKYVPTTIFGGTEQNIANLGKPIFSVSSLAAGETRTLKIGLTATCASIESIDGGQLFFTKINILGGGGSSTTISFLVETGLVVIESVTPNDFSGTLGDQFQRKIKVRNTRFGKISDIHFTDKRTSAGLTIATTGGTVTQNTPLIYEADFDQNFIKNFGDGDIFWEKDEVVEFNETIIISDCGIPMKDISSIIRVGWGCSMEQCRYDSAAAIVRVGAYTKLPNVVFSVKNTPPLDQCGLTPATQTLTLTNVGQAETSNPFIVEFTAGAVGGKDGFQANSFRMINSAGVSTNLSPVLTVSNDFPECGIEVFNKATLSLPPLAASDFMKIEVDVFYCNIDCSNPIDDIAANIFYTKKCPAGGFDSKQFFLVSTPTDTSGFRISAIIKTDIGKCLEEGPSYPFNFVVKSNALATTSGILNYKIVIPLGLSLDPACALLGNNLAPISATQIGNELNVQFQLPINDTMVSMPFCLKYLCDPNADCICPVLPTRGGSLTIPVAPPGDTSCIGADGTSYKCDLLMKYQASITLKVTDDANCGLRACNSKLISVQKICGDICSNDGPGEPIGNPGSLFQYGFKSYRTNFGFLDENNDRFADLPLQSAENSPFVVRNREMTGDTVQLNLFGTVTLGGGFKVFPFRLYHEIVASDGGLGGADIINPISGRVKFTNFDSGYVWISGFVKIKYANGQTVTCPTDEPILKEDQHEVSFIDINIIPEIVLDKLISSSEIFNIDLAGFGNCFPKNTLDLGDSIFILNNYKVMANFIPQPPIQLNPPLINTRNTFFWNTGKQYAYNREFFIIRPMQYSGFREYLTKNTFGIKPCENSIEVKPFRYSILIARPNLFPNEVRPLSRLTSYKQSAPNGLTLASSTLRYLILQDSVSILKDVPLVATNIGGYFSLNLNPLYAAPLDEGYTFRTNWTWLPNCNFADPDSSRQIIGFRYPPCFYKKTDFEVNYKNALGFFANTAELKASIPNLLVKSNTGLFDFSFLLKNIRVSAAQNTWIYFEDSLGTTSDFNVFINGVAQNNSNGVFNLGNFGGISEKNIQIKLKSTNCSPEKLLVHYGWACDAPTLAPVSGCGQDTLTIMLQNEATELDLAIKNEPDSIPFCAPSDYFEFEIFNAKNGHAFDVLASVKLPQGLSIAPNSVQISYPNGSAWQNAANPTTVSGNLFLWKINDLLPNLVAEGLPGVTDFPQNSIKIRFKVIAECGFVAESQPIFSTEGKNPCGKSTNRIRKTGDPITLAGTSPSYSAQLSIAPAVAANLPATCDEIVPLEVQITIAQGTPMPGDSIVITLPSGVEYVAGSYQTGVGAPAGPLVFLGNMAFLPLPTGINTIKFNFSVKYIDPLGCLDQSILVQVRSATTAICQSTGQPCGISVANGEAIWFLPTANPQINLLDFAILESSNGVWGFDATLQNPSIIAVNTAIMQLFNDQNGNGQLDATDILIGNFSTTSSIGAGQSGQILGNLIGNPPDLCQLLAVFKADENCACDDQIFPLGTDLSFKHLPLVFCQAQNGVPLGIDSTGDATYEWVVDDGSVSCETCANTSYNFPPDAQPGDQISIILIEKKAGCTRKHLFEISFGASFDLLASDKMICLGESILLSAISTGGGNFAWSGPGADGKTTAVLTINPTVSAAYSVTISLASGCTGEKMIFIEVLNSDSILLPKIVRCPGETVVVFGQNVSNSGIYFQKYPKSNGCDSTIYQPVEFLNSPKTNEPAKICAGDSLVIFQNQVVKTAGNYCKSFQAANGCDSTHCVNLTVSPKPVVPAQDTLEGIVGDQIILNAPAGFVEYNWGNPFQGSQNATSQAFTPDSSGIYQFDVNVKNANGCNANVPIILRVFPPCNPAKVRMPNVFTPNGDDLNDTFQPYIAEGSEKLVLLKIYNRWGAKIYESNDATAAWDGKINGQPAPLDVYIWVISIDCFSEKTERSGDLTLTR